MASREFSPTHAYRRRKATVLLAVSLLALGLAGCLKRGDGEITGSIAQAGREPATEEAWRSYAQDWGKRYEANPADKTAAINYARGLRNLEQRAQAVAVLQQAAIRVPKDMDILGAYGRALSDVGRLKEAADVLSRAHVPEKPDWRVLSAQGAVADQLGDQPMAQRFYEEALKIVPGEPSVLSNLGLSYALAKRLPEAEQALRQASDHPRADARVRQNLALVLGLQGKFNEAEGVFRRDMAPTEVAANLGFLKQSVSQPNNWEALRGLDRTARGKTPVKTDTAVPARAPAAAHSKPRDPDENG